MNNKKPKVGDKVYTQNDNLEPKEYVVTKIGRRYFYAKNDLYSIKVEIDEWKELNAYGGRFPVYESIQELEEFKECLSIRNFIRKFFCNYGSDPNYDILKMRKIKEIIDSGVVVVKS